MSLSWADASEIVSGLLLDGRIARNAVRSDIFAQPYDEIVHTILSDPNVGVQTLVEMYGTATVAAMLEAPKNLPQTTVNWVQVLEKACNSYQAGVDLEKISKKLKIGEQVDLSSLASIANKAQTDTSNRLVPAIDIQPREAAFVLSGWAPIDETLAGIPETGLVVIGARPGTGKTWFGLTLMYHFLKEHPDKNAAFFSAEMSADELRERLDHMTGKTREGVRKPVEESVLKRLFIDDSSGLTVDIITNRAAGLENLGMIVIDYADLIVEGIDEPSYTKMYLNLAKAAKNFRIPLFLIAQLSGSYSGGIPRPQNLRYTRLAEAAAWMILMLWNPAKDSYEDDGSGAALPVYNNRAYCIVWKIRGGFKLHPDDNPGAILIPFKGEAWHPTMWEWFSLAKDEQLAPRKLKKRRDD